LLAGCAVVRSAVDACIAARRGLDEAFARNLEALAIELRETGELMQLLARAAAGHPLDGEQRAKVRAQLVDVAKAIPALAVLAAPGGLLLLPLLARVLPFSLLPSAWAAPRPPRLTAGVKPTDG
jgi:hypothetical protein